MAHDVFISYSTKDKTIADTVCAMLEERHIRCWIAPRDIIPGQNFAKSIIDGIDSSKVFLLIWSANTNLSRHILNEVNQAFDQGITIIPFRIEDVQPTTEMRYYLGRTHWLDALTPPLEKHISSLARTILANLGRPAEEVPQPPGTESVQEELTPERVEAAGQGAPPERTPAPSPKGKKKWLTLGLPALVILAALAVGLLSQNFKAFSPTLKTQAASPTDSKAAVTPKPTSTPTSTAVVTETAPPTATLAAWVAGFSNPILGAITSHPPDFQDDFSHGSSNWKLDLNNPGIDCSTSWQTIEGGSLKLAAGPDNGCYSLAQMTKSLANFAFQVEMDLSQAAQYIKADMMFGTGEDNFSLFSDQHWEVVACPQDYCNTAFSGYVEFDPSRPVTVTFISYLDRNAIQVNDSPAFYSDNKAPVVKNGIRLGVMKTGESATGTSNVASFDNIKIWDLDKIPNLADLLK